MLHDAAAGDPFARLIGVVLFLHEAAELSSDSHGHTGRPMLEASEKKLSCICRAWTACLFTVSQAYISCPLCINTILLDSLSHFTSLSCFARESRGPIKRTWLKGLCASALASRNQRSVFAEDIMITAAKTPDMISRSKIFSSRKVSALSS